VQITDLPFPARRAMASLDETTVLVVDDDPSVTRLLSLAFGLEGFTVCSAADGEEALECARRERPGAIILDAIMPGLTGMDVCRTIRAELGWGPTIVILTGHTDLADRLAALESGADDYVVKPMRVIDLVEKVKTRLHRAASPRPRSLLGGPQIYDEMQRRMSEPTAAVFVEVRGLRPFTARYSFARGERLLDFVGDLLLELTADEPGALVGRLGAEEFLVVTRPEGRDSLTDRLVRAYASQRPHFYDPADAKRGWIEVTDRQGRTSRHRFLPLAVGVAVTHQEEGGQHHLELLERAAEMARYARAHGPVAVDRRQLTRSRAPARA
jgi:DNA-binding response OmpR family regulator